MIDSKMITFLSLLALLCLAFLIAVAVFSLWRLHGRTAPRTRAPGA
ncbi:MAG: hypothetical protein M5U19_05810 [Microthrixaceae bacterium]|nr:hypothetical protein [Microthrixaceae bacterium]